MTSLLRFLLALALLASLVSPAKAGAILEGDMGDAMLTKTTINSTFYHNNMDLEVGGLFNNDNGAIVEAFSLPYLAPGQQVTGATISFYMDAINYTPATNVQLYGLNRVSATSAAPIQTDWYVGTNDTANTLLAPKFVTPTSKANQAQTYNGSNLVSFIQKQYANAAFNSKDMSYSTRWVFFRLSPNTAQSTSMNFQFASARHPTRAWRPTLTLTISNGLTNVDGRLQFSFTLPNDAVTSAGVYDPATGKLLRTLWNNVKYQAGMNYGVWDGKDDSGAALSIGNNYQVKLIFHNVQYIWDGTIGNTSANQSGPNVYRNFIQPIGMAIAGNKAYYSIGYNELQNVFHNFTIGAPQVPSEIHAGFGNPYSAMTLVTADTTRSYWAKGNGGVAPAATTYVMAINNSDQSFYTFPKGTKLPSNQPFPSGVDYDTTANMANPASGIVVQQTGSVLFVSHSNLNVVRAFDKVQGNLLGTISVPTPTGLAVTANGDLWVISKGTSLMRYTFASGQGTLKQTITGLSGAMGVGVSPDDTKLVVSDGGTSDQVKVFNNNTGAAIFTYGKLGGMDVNGPAINSNTFYFHAAPSYVAFQADGTVWIGDGANRRNMHFGFGSNTLNYIEHISYVNISYTSGVDLTDATRVFDTFFEFSRDYSKPLGGTNGSWALVNNWAAGLLNDATHNYQGFRSGLNNVVTLSNGHTYSVLNNFATSKSDLIELSLTGPARVTGYSFDNFPRIYADGSLRFNIQTATSISYYSQALTGFDANNNPKWGSPSLLGTSNIAANDPQTWVTFPERTEVTASGVVVTFDPFQGRSGYHLAGIAKGGTSWQWKTSPSTTTAYTGWFPQDGKFDIGNGVQYGGNLAHASGRNIVYGYHGEFWKNNQASQWVNFYDNGLMVGLFGLFGGNVNGFDVTDGFCGNSFTSDIVRAPNGKTYLYCNDESNHGGDGCWRIEGWDNITEIKGTSAIGAIAALNGGNGPTVLITSPTAGASYYNGNQILLSAEAGGNGAALSYVEFFDGTTSLGKVSVAPFNIVTTAMSPGVHTLTANAFDGSKTTTSPAVSITIGSDGASTPPPAPIALAATANAAQTVSLAWSQPLASSTSSGIGQIISFQCDYTGDSATLASTAVAGAPNYAVSKWNILGRSATAGLIFSNPVNNSGVTIPNLGINAGTSYSTASGSTGKLTGTTANLFNGGVTTLFAALPGISISNIPYAHYDLVVYSLAPGLATAAKSAKIIVSDSLKTGTITQNFTTAPTNYAVTTVAFGTDATLTNMNTVIISGMTSSFFELQGGNLMGFQIVERPYDQGAVASYSIERAPSSGSFAAIGTAASGTVSFKDTTVAVSTPYQYRVKALNSFGSSAYSNVAAVTTSASSSTTTSSAPTTTPPVVTPPVVTPPVVTPPVVTPPVVTPPVVTPPVTTPPVTTPPVVTPPATTLTGFAAWQAKYFTASQLADVTISGATADPYGSGVQNLLAYALQLDPATARPSDVPHASVKNGHLTLTYLVPTAITDVTFVVEVSTDLRTWNSGNGYTTVLSNITGTTGHTITVQDTLASTVRKHFMHLRVTQK